MRLFGEERQEGNFEGGERRIFVIYDQRQGIDRDGRLGNQVAGRTIVAGQIRLDQGFGVLVGMMLLVTSALRHALRKLSMSVMILARMHRQRGIALQGQPQQHEGEHESGQKEFHRIGSEAMLLRMIGNIAEMRRKRKRCFGLAKKALSGNLTALLEDS